MKYIFAIAAGLIWSPMPVLGATVMAGSHGRLTCLVEGSKDRPNFIVSWSPSGGKRAIVTASSAWQASRQGGNDDARIFPRGTQVASGQRLEQALLAKDKYSDLAAFSVSIVVEGDDKSIFTCVEQRATLDQTALLRKAQAVAEKAKARDGVDCRSVGGRIEFVLKMAKENAGKEDKFNLDSVPAEHRQQMQDRIRENRINRQKLIVELMSEAEAAKCD